MSEQPSKDPKLDPNRQWEADFEERATRTSNDLLSLLRFRVLDYRNATEEARERLMLEAADEIERLRRGADETAVSRVVECNCYGCQLDRELGRAASSASATRE